MNSEALLEHSKFIRSLARSLVLDESSADDLTQKTWLAALKKTPKEEPPHMGWLSKVVHNLARMEKRTSVRRYKREKIVAVSEAVRSTEDVFERQAQTQLIFDAVMSLKDPYRSAILLRFYDDMPPRKIAREVDAPVTTVKTWLQRGQSQLRKKLDAEFGGDRESWKLALAPIAGLSLATSTAGASTTATTAALSSGVGVAALKLGLVGLMAAAGLIFLTGLWNILPEEVEQSPLGLVESPVNRGSIEMPLEDLAGYDRGRSAFQDEQSQKVAILPTHSLISGRVTDLVTGDPIESFDLRLSPVVGMRNTPVLDDKTLEINSREGLFSLPFDGRPGLYTLSVKTARHRTKDVTVRLPAETGSTDLKIALDPGLSLSGRIADAETNEPIEDAIVGVKNGTWLDKILLDSPGGGIYVKSDSDGLFTLGGIGKGACRVVASHPDFAQISIDTWSAAAGIEIRLVRGYRIFGTVLSDQGEPLQGVVINISGDGIDLRRAVLSGPDGRYRTPPVIAGSRLRIMAYCPQEDTAEPDQSSAQYFTRESRKIQIDTKNQEVNFGPSKEHITWKGTLCDASENPVGGGMILAAAPSLGVTQSAWCDSEGHFEFRKIQPGTGYRITLFFPEFESQIPFGMLDFRPNGSGIVEQDLAISGGSIAGQIFHQPGRTAARSGTVEAISTDLPSSTEMYQATVGEEGSFRLRGLPHGTYTLTYYYNPSHSVDRISGKKKIIDETGALRLFEVNEGQAISNIFLFVPPKGTLCVIGTGFEKHDRLDLRLTPAENDISGELTIPMSLTEAISSSGDLDYACMVTQGIWAAEFLLAGNSAAFRNIQINNEELIELEINRSDLQPGPLTTRLEGVLRNAGGLPIKGARLSLTSSNQDPRSVLPKFTTDGEGKFIFHGLPAGQWDLRVHMRDERDSVDWNVEFIFNDHINNEPLRQSLLVPVILPSGEAGFRLCDSLTGLRLPESVSWTVCALGDDNKRRSVVMGWGSVVEVNGLPEGWIRFSVTASGYKSFESDSFFLAEGERRDLGEVNLERVE